MAGFETQGVTVSHAIKLLTPSCPISVSSTEFYIGWCTAAITA